MAEEFETVYDGDHHLNPMAEVDFSLSEVNDLWEELTHDQFDPTLTFETSERGPQIPSDFSVPTRRLGTWESKEDDVNHSLEYMLGEKLGEGGMGVIFEANQSALNRSVAIKMLKSEANSEAQRKKFLSEAVLTGALQHPNIIALHDLAVDQNDNLFYSMKKINGEPWSKTIRQKSLDENLEVFLRICNAVAFAHSRGVIHRDIKPGNVMLGEFGEVLLLDWGLAVVLPQNRQLQNKEFPGLGGTPSYMSPELARGEFDKLSPQSDVYLLGAVLYEIITKIPPHTGESVNEVLKNAANNIIEATSKKGELISIAFDAMATRIDQRISSAMELRSMVRNFQTHTQSMGITRRAKKFAKRARQNNDYILFANAILTFEEALDVWADNKKAINGLSLTKKYYTESAIENGDLDLAASILDGVDSKTSGPNLEPKSLSQKVSQLKKDRAKRQRQRDKDKKDLKKWSESFNVSPDIVAISRLRDGLIFEVNKAYLKTLGYMRSEVIGKSIGQLNIWADPKHRDEFVHVLETVGHCEEWETILQTKTGQQIPVLLSAGILGFDGEKAIITHAHSIARRKKMEKRLLDSERRFRETQQLAKLGTWEYNLETEKIIWSDETFRIIGLSQEIGEPTLEGFLSTVHPDDAPELLSRINQAQTDGKPYNLEIRHKDPEGGYKRIVATGKPHFENGRVISLFGSVMDITDFRQST